MTRILFGSLMLERSEERLPEYVSIEPAGLIAEDPFTGAPFSAEGCHLLHAYTEPGVPDKWFLLVEGPAATIRHRVLSPVTAGPGLWRIRLLAA